MDGVSDAQAVSQTVIDAANDVEINERSPMRIQRKLRGTENVKKMNC